LGAALDELSDDVVVAAAGVEVEAVEAVEVEELLDDEDDELSDFLPPEEL